MSNFRRVLNVVFFILGDTPASEFYRFYYFIKFRRQGITQEKEYNRSLAVGVRKSLSTWVCISILSHFFSTLPVLNMWLLIVFGPIMGFHFDPYEFLL